MKKGFNDYEADVVYDVWMSGGNVDAIDSDRVRDCYDEGLYHEETAALIFRGQMRRSAESGG